MLKALLSGIAVAALTGTAIAADIPYVPPPAIPPAPPAPAVQAHVDLYGGYFSYDWVGPDNGYVVGGAGRANVPLQENWNFQMDAQGSAWSFSGGKGGWSIPEFAGYAHLYKRDPNSHALGIFGGANFFSGPQVYTAGVEGQMYWPQFTLYGQASVSSINCSGPCYSQLTGLQLRAEGRWYLTDNTALLGDVIWTHFTGDDEFNAVTVAGALMHRFNQGPFAGFIKGRWDTVTDGGAPQWSAVAGLRVLADPPGSTLKSHRRTGPAMDVEQPIFAAQSCWYADCRGID